MKNKLHIHKDHSQINPNTIRSHSKISCVNLFTKKTKKKKHSRKTHIKAQEKSTPNTQTKQKKS